jgi:hypothetical protein
VLDLVQPVGRVRNLGGAGRDAGLEKVLAHGAKIAGEDSPGRSALSTAQTAARIRDVRPLLRLWTCHSRQSAHVADE